MSNVIRYISIEELQAIVGKSMSSIYARRKEIPGLTYEDGVYTILEGTRYPCDLHRFKMENSEEKRYVLLKTISENKYISARDLRLYQRQFEAFLKDLLDAGLIRPNNMCNTFGANAYDCTPDGDAVISKRKKKALSELAELVASSAGSFAGAVVSQMYGGVA